MLRAARQHQPARVSPPWRGPARAAWLLAIVTGCVSVKPAVLDRHTQLEHQLIGQLWPLEARLILASSVRGGGAAAGTVATPAPAALEQDAQRAAQRRAFNADDLELLKQQQVLGEGRDGELKLLHTPTTTAEAERVRALLAEENADRVVLWRRALQLSPELDSEALSVVREVFHRLVLEVARPGERVQRADGRWVTIAARPEAVVVPTRR